MLWLIYIFLIFLGLILKRSRCYGLAVILFMGAVAYLNTDSADYIGIYLRTYLNPTAVPNMDVGWVVLCQIGSFLGLSYNAFAGVLTIISMTVLVAFGWRANVNTSFMLALFLIYPGLMSIVQFRQFVASAIGAIALMALSSNARGRYILFTGLIYLASLVHRSALIMFLVLIWPVMFKAGRKGRAVLVLILAAAAAFCLANAETLSSFVFGDFRTGVYLSANGGSTAASLPVGIRNATLLAGMALIPYLCCRAEIGGVGSSSISSSLFDSVGISIAGIIALFNIVLIALVPFVFITNDFMRFERYGFTYALVLFARQTKEPVGSIFTSKVCFLVLCIAFAAFYVANTFDSVYGALLSFEYFPELFL